MKKVTLDTNSTKGKRTIYTDPCLHHCVENVKIIAIQLNKTSNNEESYIRHKFNERDEIHFIRIRVYNIVLIM